VEIYIMFIFDGNFEHYLSSTCINVK